jgi:hypothetical protein
MMCKKRNAVDLQIARRMRTVGVPLDTEEFEEPLIVIQDREPGANSLASCYLTRNCIGTVVKSLIKIIGNSTVPLEISDFRLRLPWKDTPVTLLQDPAGPFAPQTYKLGAEKFDRSEVIRQSGKLRRGDFIKGYILGTDNDLIETTVADRSVVRAVFSFADQFENIHTQELLLRVDRRAERAPKPRTTHPPRPSLFDLRDSVPVMRA